jgi:hypothetical protein
MDFPAEALKSTRVLPESHERLWGLDLYHDRKAAVLLNLAGLPLLLLAGWLFAEIAVRLRPEILNRALLRQFAVHPFAGLVLLLTTVVVFLTVHEGIHGFFFWLFTGSKPVFGLKLLFAYAGAPDWYIPRIPYVLIGLAPLVSMSIAGFMLIPFVSVLVAQLVLFGMVLNASGAVGDLYVSIKVMRESRDALVRDTGAEFTVFGNVTRTPKQQKRAMQGGTAYER